MRDTLNFWQKRLNPFSERSKRKRTSYSQCGEDLIFEHILSDRIIMPTYLDIGAHHPWYLSNTAKYYLKGAKGVNIEPDPDLYKLFLKERKNDVNLNIGIASQASFDDFYIMQPKTLNTFSKKDALIFEQEYGFNIKQILKIKVLTLPDIIQTYFSQSPPDIINIDVEGLDFDIVKQIDFNKPPKIICIETISYSETGHGIKNYEIIDYITGRGFLKYADTYINTIFVLKNFWER